MLHIAQLTKQILKLAANLERHGSTLPSPRFNRLAGELARLSALRLPAGASHKICAALEAHRPGVLHFLRAVASEGHRQLEFRTIEAARAVRSIPKKFNSKEARLTALFKTYPYGWASPRSSMQARLIGAYAGHPVDRSWKLFVCSQSGLGLAGMFLHLTTGASVTYLDTDLQSIEYARTAFELLDRHGIIEGSLAVRYVYPENLTHTLPRFADPAKTAFIVNTPALLREHWLNSLAPARCALLLTVAPEELGKLSYEPLQIDRLEPRVRKNLRIVVRPAGYAPVRGLRGVQQIPWNSKDSTMSTLLFSAKPIGANRRSLDNFADREGLA